ncbi:MAG: arsenosugar biosynthesis radical SAM protein ArsS [Proteobacteria bacterium]|nr:arsenosugar biosynthesis radical SAM protein ArsS [Pseudomonadota bacterium]MBU4053411.1 arsenosugar biosynthesis radical SAM protein ArsS [Pseudomonadota bacterium]
MNAAYPWEQIRPPETFRQTLANHGLVLSRKKTTALQVNVGLLCNQRCRHCHLSAGPDRKENMDSETMDDIIAYADRSRFEAIDITGGAPELNPNIVKLIEGLFPQAPRITFRSNLSVLSDGKRHDLIRLLKEKSVGIVASFPSLNEAQADAQRGNGIFRKSVDTLLKLNALGYGNPETRLTLDLVSNPAGAFLPGSQDQLEKRFRDVLLKKWGIIFNNLYAFANAPLGRFRNWLDEKGNLEAYLERLSSGFNSCTVEGLMCRSLVSVSWDGVLHDCDFNLSRGLHLGAQRTHVSEMPGPPEEGLPIAVGDHCYTCTAGAGFT